MTAHRFAFERLVVYGKAKTLACFVHELRSGFPAHERYGLGAQLGRAAISVISNLAEGSARLSKKDQAHFTQMSYSSLMEVLCQLDLAHDLAYITEDQLLTARARIEEIARMLNALRRMQVRTGESA
jgi:four helix bundle protein